MQNEIDINELIVENVSSTSHLIETVRKAAEMNEVINQYVKTNVDFDCVELPYWVGIVSAIVLFSNEK